MNPASVLICKGCILSLDYGPTINSNALNAWVQKNQFSNLCAVFSGQVANNERNHLFETFTKPSATLSPASNSEVSALVTPCVLDASTNALQPASEKLANQLHPDGKKIFNIPENTKSPRQPSHRTI